ATGHLLYSRFWTKVLCDRGYISFDEPFKKMINQGMILGRSNFVYRLLISSGVSSNHGDNIDLIPVNALPPIFISKELLSTDERSVQEIKNNPTIKRILSEYEHELKSKQPNKRGELEPYSILRSHVDISFTDNDILDKDSFKRNTTDFANAKFIPLDGNYICGWEIEKMSKSKYNVQTPDELVEKFGADTLRMYEMFLGPVEQSKPWDTKGINGVHNFLRKLWRLCHDGENNFVVSDDAPSKRELKILHTAIKKVTEDLNRYSWNTVVSTLMICVNELTDEKSNKRGVLESLTILLSPYAPHLAEELWESLGHTDSVTNAIWPEFNAAYLEEDTFEYPISFNGKTRFFIPLGVALSQDEVTQAVMAHEQTAKYLEGKAPKKVIVVPKRIVNVVV
ncbi:MAG: class I tRNA ligase family protein, partial [Flavobacteriales bacterium]|nr:class I tRNA ligase family protein [Flavobacteriales bacterium]